MGWAYVGPQDHRLRWVHHSPLLPTTTNVVQPHTMVRGRRREGEQSTSTSVGRSSIEEMAKLNSLSLLSSRGKLYIQLYPSSPSTAAMLLQWLDKTAGLTLAPALAVATVRQVSRSAPAPAAATVPQQGAFSAPPSPAVCSHRDAADYLRAYSSQQLILVKFYIQWQLYSFDSFFSVL